MDKGRILIIDDEPDFVRLVTDNLKREGYQVNSANNGRKGIQMAMDSRPDVVLLDWNLPGKDGIEVCRTLKSEAKTKNIPVIMLTARDEETDVVLGLEMGAEDFIPKRGLRSRELIARVRTALRRIQAPVTPGEVLHFQDLILDTDQRQVTIAGEDVDLRSKEFDLLYVFLKNKSRVLTRNFLEETIWGTEYYGTTRAIDITVARLKSKLGRIAPFIESVKGLGYKLSGEQ